MRNRAIVGTKKLFLGCTELSQSIDFHDIHLRGFPGRYPMSFIGSRRNTPSSWASVAGRLVTYIVARSYAPPKNRFGKHLTFMKKAALGAALHEAFGVGCQLHPVVLPQVSHFKHVPLRTKVKFPHSPQASPS